VNGIHTTIRTIQRPCKSLLYGLAMTDQPE
jgi:hypothetical protein